MRLGFTDNWKKAICSKLRIDSIMKKLTFIRSIDTRHGGAENFMRRLMDALKAQGIECDKMHSAAPKCLPSWVKAWWFNWQTRFAKKNRFYFSLDRIDSADIYRAGDGVHKVFMQTKKKRFNPLNWTYCTLEKRCFQNSRHIIANCHMIKDQIINTYAIAPDKISVIYNGIVQPTIDLEAAKQKIIREFNLDPTVPVILFVGSGFERKGVANFLDILSLLQYHFHAFVVGKDKQSEKYQQQARNLGIANKVTFTGMRDDVEHFYACADIFLYPANYEPFANVMLEAMSHQCAAFTSKECGVFEILPHEFVINKYTPSVIDSLITDKYALSNAKATHHTISQNFTIEQTATETLAVIKEFMHD